jgi:hypothetical protein
MFSVMLAIRQHLSQSLFELVVGVVHKDKILYFGGGVKSIFFRSVLRNLLSSR